MDWRENYRFFAAFEIAVEFGKEKAKPFLFVHALAEQDRLYIPCEEEKNHKTPLPKNYSIILFFGIC